MQGYQAQQVMIECGQSVQEVAAALAALFWQSSDEFLFWLGSRFSERTHPFERAVIESELEILREFSAKQKQAVRNVSQLALL
jgi:hypothetical protein